MKIFDLHCDTAFEMQKRGVGLCSGLQISLDRVKSRLKPEKYTLVTAIWQDPSLNPDAAYAHFFRVRSHLVKSLASFLPLRFPEVFDCILAVEGCGLVSDDLARLENLRQSGVRIIAPVWKGLSAIGGAYDRDEGLTEFGKRLVHRAFCLGMTLDVSHCSDASFYDIMELADMTNGKVIASHSDMRAVCGIRRNLSDDMFINLRRRGGITGVCLAPSHLTSAGSARISDVIKHIDHCISLGGEDSIALGCDFDGIASTPLELTGAECLGRLYELLCREYSQGLADAVFYDNAERFFRGADSLGRLIQENTGPAGKDDG